MSFRINNKLVGDGSPAYIVAEMAWSHDGSFENAKKIISAASEARADAICIHLTHMPDYMVADYTPVKGGATSSADKEKLYDFLSKKNLSEGEWKYVIKLAHDSNLAVCAMCNDIYSVHFAARNGVDVFVIPPASIQEIGLLEAVAKYGKPVFVRIGGAYQEEIKRAIDVMRANGADKLSLIHGFQNFPTELDEMNLNLIAGLKSKYGIPVGFADHIDGGSEMALTVPVAAVAKGAGIIEKHLTYDRLKKGLDYESALDPDDFSTMVETIRKIEKSFGTTEFDKLSNKEIAYRENVRKRAVAAKDLTPDSIVNYENFVFKRANSGIYPDEVAKFLNKKLQKAMKKDESLSRTNIG
jgi:sialic acid synthase SpsE